MGRRVRRQDICVNAASGPGAASRARCGLAPPVAPRSIPSVHFGATHALQKIRQYRPVRFRAVPRHHDLRRRGRHLGPDRRPAAGRRRAHSSAARSRPASTSSTRPTSIPKAASEIITGQALKNLKVAARARGGGDQGVRRDGHRRQRRGASRYHIIDGVKASLKRLQLDHIDLYQIHGFDPATPIEETLRALDTLVQHGHVRYIGVSNWAAWQIAKALGITRAAGPGAVRVAAGVLHHRRPRPGARDRADAGRAKTSA